MCTTTVQASYWNRMILHGRLMFDGLAWGVAAMWLSRLLPALRMLPRVPDLLDSKYGEDLEAWPSVTVIVPAKDEAEAIDRSLRSLLASDYPGLELVAVDDRSIDATGLLMDRLAGEPIARDRLRVLHVKNLPDGWLGKPHAMALAVADARTDWLLFTDADVIFAPGMLRRVMSFAVASRADHCVVYPTLILKGWAEHMLVAFFQSLSALFGRPWKITDAHARRDYIGIGAFNLIRRPTYEALGGFSGLRMEVLEDLRLGFEVKHEGYAQRVAFGRNLIRIRWAESARGILHNLTKNMYAAVRFRTALAVAAVLAGTLLCLTPFVALLFDGPARWAGVATLACLLLLNIRYWRQTRISPLYLVLFPLAAVLFLLTLMRSCLLALWRGGVLWRGTLYPLDDLRRRTGPLW